MAASLRHHADNTHREQSVLTWGTVGSALRAAVVTRSSPMTPRIFLYHTAVTLDLSGDGPRRTQTPAATLSANELDRKSHATCA